MDRDPNTRWVRTLLKDENLGGGFVKQPRRFLRVIEYVGELAWLVETLDNRKIKGRVDFGDDKGFIQEAVVGETPELLEFAAIEAEANRIVNRVACPDCLRKPCATCGGTGYRSPWLDVPVPDGPKLEQVLQGTD